MDDINKGDAVTVNVQGFPSEGWRVARVLKSGYDLRHAGYVGAIRFTKEEVTAA